MSQAIPDVATPLARVTDVCFLLTAIPGYYADTEAECQSFHICGPSPEDENQLIKYTFLCPNGTIFNQQYFICDWWFNFDCTQANDLADTRNQELFRAREEATRRQEEQRQKQRQQQRQQQRFRGDVAASSNRVETTVDSYLSPSAEPLDSSQAIPIVVVDKANPQQALPSYG